MLWRKFAEMLGVVHIACVGAVQKIFVVVQIPN